MELRERYTTAGKMLAVDSYTLARLGFKHLPPRRARAIGGRFNGKQYTWYFPAERGGELVALLQELYGLEAVIVPLPDPEW